MANSASVRRRGSWAETAAWANLFFNLSWCGMKMYFVKGVEGRRACVFGSWDEDERAGRKREWERVAAFTRLRWRNQSLIE
jgi:hypothetical protein